MCELHPPYLQVGQLALLALDGRNLPPIPDPILGHLSVMVDLGRGRPLSQMALLMELKECKAAYKKVGVKWPRYANGLCLPGSMASVFLDHDRHALPPRS